MKKISLILLFLSSLITDSLKAQIGGLTGTKAVAIATDVIPVNSIEFSPTWSFNRTSSSFDENGDSNSSDLIEQENGICWMLSYGLGEKTEVGINIPGSFEPVSLAVKHRFFESEMIDLGAMIGLNFSLREGLINSTLTSESDATSFGVGLIGKFQFETAGSLDVNFQVQDYFEKDSPEEALFFTAEYGTYVLDGKLALLAAVNFQENLGDSDSRLFSAGPGLSFEAGENYVLVISTLHDFLGRNSSKGLFGQFGLTVILD